MSIGGKHMNDIKTLRRILYDHNWSSVAHWVSALHDLADLTDDDIARLQRPIGASPHSKTTSRE